MESESESESHDLNLFIVFTCCPYPCLTFDFLNRFPTPRLSRVSICLVLALTDEAIEGEASMAECL